MEYLRSSVVSATLRLAQFCVIGLLVVTAPFASRPVAAQQDENAVAAAQQAQQTSSAHAYPFRPRHGVDTDDAHRSRRLSNGSTITPGPAGAHLTYYGGPVVSSIKIVVVYYGNGAYLPQLSTDLPNFYTAVTNGTYMDMLSEYSTQGVSGGGTTGNEIIARGGSNAFLGSYTITPSATNNGSTITDAQIQAELLAQINASHLPAPDYDANGNADTIYMIYFPPGKTITQGGSSSCVSGGFCAYHGTINNSGRNLLYGVQPDMQSGSGCYTGCGNSTVFNNYTSVGSHEFAEAITDAAVGLATVTGPPLAWYDNTNGENGDICNAIQGTADGYTVQAEWSNLQNGCALAPPTFTITAPASTGSGSSFSITVQTRNSAGSNMSTYRGAIHFTSTDSSATLPADYTFTSTDAGAHTFTGVVLRTTGSQTVSAAGVINVGFRGTSTAINVGTVSANDFSIAASPATLTLASGASGTSTISTAVTSGSASTVSLSVSGTPAGATATLSPPSVTAGGSSTLSVNAGTAAAGNYTLTITGTEGTMSHTTTVALTVSSTTGGGSGITNGGFESGLTGWTTSGASVSAVSASCHSGAGCARAGSTAATNGDSSLAQIFTAPTGSTGISFWYKMTCPDSVTYDWATATLKDNTTGTTATLLPKVCATNASWVNVTGGLTAGHSYTLTLTNHDDNYSSDPSYTLYDDVAITTTTAPSGIANGGFETGTSSGWTTSGASESIASSGCHSGTYCARAGSTTATNGDSSFAQTFTVPTGKSQLSVWYKMTCPDTVTYDWSTITLKNNTSGTTATLLGKTCSTNASWVNILGSVTAGASYTLTLTSHDDNYSSDPTYTLFDDAALN